MKNICRICSSVFVLRQRYFTDYEGLNKTYEDHIHNMICFKTKKGLKEYFKRKGWKFKKDNAIWIDREGWVTLIRHSQIERMYFYK